MEEKRNNDQRCPLLALLKESLEKLPLALRRKVNLLSFGAFLFALFCLFLAGYFREWKYLYGLLGCVYLLWLGLDICLDHQKGKIVCGLMRCNSKVPILSKKRLHLVMQDNTAQGPVIREFNIYLSKRDAKLFREGGWYYIYYRPEIRQEILAWELAPVSDENAIS